MVVEFAQYGCLRDFLRRNRPPTIDDEMNAAATGKDIELTTELLTSFAWQTASGMEFMASNKVRHQLYLVQLSS